MEYNVLQKPLGSYSAAGLKGAMSIAKRMGRGLMSAEGTIIMKAPETQLANASKVKTPEQKVNSDSGDSRDSNKVAASLNIAGLTNIAPSLNHGILGGNSGVLGMQKAYVTIVQKPPVGTEDLNKYIGLPLEAKMNLSLVTGYTEVSNIFIPTSGLNSILNDEEMEIRDLLSGGVIF